MLGLSQVVYVLVVVTFVGEDLSPAVDRGQFGYRSITQCEQAGAEAMEILHQRAREYQRAVDVMFTCRPVKTS